MPGSSEAAHGVEQLTRAVREFFEEGYEYPVASKILRDTPAELQAEARRKLLPPRTAPDGCFVWLAYLIWLERVLDLSPGIGAMVSLHATETEGLLLLKRERSRFQASHPPCPHCGMPNEVHALRCRECMGEIAK